MANPVQEANETLKAINDALLRQEVHARRLRGELGAPPSPNSADGSEDEVIRQLQCALVAEGEALAETIVQVWAEPFKCQLLLVPPTGISLLSGENISWVRHLVTAMQDAGLTAIELDSAVVTLAASVTYVQVMTANCASGGNWSSPVCAFEWLHMQVCNIIRADTNEIAQAADGAAEPASSSAGPLSAIGTDQVCCGGFFQPSKTLYCCFCYTCQKSIFRMLWGPLLLVLQAVSQGSKVQMHWI